jgi:hypothetical protein
MAISEALEVTTNIDLLYQLSLSKMHVDVYFSCYWC